MNSSVNPEVNRTTWATRARRAAKSAIPSQRRSAASGTGEPSDQAANRRAVPAATVRAPAAATRPAIGSPAPSTHSGYVHQLQRHGAQLHRSAAGRNQPRCSDPSGTCVSSTDKIARRTGSASARSPSTLSISRTLGCSSMPTILPHAHDSAIIHVGVNIYEDATEGPEELCIPRLHVSSPRSAAANCGSGRSRPWRPRR